MLIEKLLNKIRNDDAIAALFTSDLQDIVVPFLTGSLPAIVYSYSPVTDNGVKRIDRLEIRVISTDYEQVLKADEAIRNCLLSIGDIYDDNQILDININGGGSLFDDGNNTYHQFCFFMISSR